MLKTQVRLDMSKGDAYEKKVVNGLELTTNDLADAIIEDIRNNWSPESPSAWGMAPAKVTGNLDRSLLKTQGRAASGRFAAPGDAVSITIRSDAPYSGILESEDGLNRPFFEPAFERASFVFDISYRKLFT